MPTQNTTQEQIQFDDPKTLDELRLYIEKNVVVFDMLDEAYAFVRGYTEFRDHNLDFEQKHPELASEYRRLLVLAMWIAAVRIQGDEFLDLFRSHFVDALKNPDIVVFDKIIAHLVTLPLKDRDSYKRKIREALLKNEERLTAEYLVDSDGNRKDPTVQNWLGDYHAVLGTGKISKLKQMEYLEKSANPQKLSPQEKESLQKLIQLYERFKISSLTPEGMENSLSVRIGNKKMILRNGRFEPVKLSRREQELMNGSFDIMRKTSEWRAQGAMEALKKEYSRVHEWIAPKVQRFDRIYGYYAKSLSGDFIQMAAEGKKEDVAAALVLLAQKNGMFDIFVRPGFWYDRTIALLNKRFHKEIVSQFEEELFSPPFLLILLQDLLKDFPPADQPVIGVMIATAMESQHKEYGRMAYANSDWGAFVWGNVAVIGDRLALVEALPPREARGLSPFSKGAEGISDEEIRRLQQASEQKAPEKEDVVQEVLRDIEEDRRSSM